MSIAVHCIFEDSLSGAVIERIIEFVSTKYGKNYFVHKRDDCGGCSKIIQNIDKYNLAAKNLKDIGHAFFVLIDLDRHTCAPSFISEILTKEKSSNLFLRIAEKEVESWLLSDCENLCKHLRIEKQYLDLFPDNINDPKERLLNMSGHSKSKTIRKDMIHESGNGIGQGYNSLLIEFVRNSWDIDRSMERSNSLKRAISDLMNYPR